MWLLSGSKTRNRGDEMKFPIDIKKTFNNSLKKPGDWVRAESRLTKRGRVDKIHASSGNKVSRTTYKNCTVWTITSR